MKAQIRTLEAVIAVTILIGTLIAFSHKNRPMHKLSILGYKLDAYNAFRLLEETGQLRENVMNNNVKELEESLKPFIKCNFDVIIFNETTNVTIIPKFVSNEIVTACYYIAGNLDEYSPKKVCVYMWGFE